MGIDLDANSRARAAPGEHLPDTFDLCQFLRQDGIGGVINQRGRNIVGGQREHQDRRVGWINLAIVWLAGHVRRELAASRVDGSLNVARCGVDVTIEIELQSDAGVAKAARRSHLRDTSDAAKLAFKGSGNRGRHGFGTCSGQTRSDRDGRKIHLRERRHGQEPERNDAGKQNREGDQRRGHGPSDKGRGEIGRKMLHLVPVRGLFDRITNLNLEAPPEPIECQVDHRSGVKR